MRYFINNRTGGMTSTDNATEAERLMTVGFREISEEAYDAEDRRAWAIATGTW